MIRRRIESGDIPVHWVEAEGKLEMRVAQEDISSGQEAEAGYGSGAPLPPQYGVGPTPGAGSPGPNPDDPPGSGWLDTSGSEYPQGLWTPAEESESLEASPWDAGSEEMPLTEPEGATVPVWRPDPATWEDEPLQEGEALSDQLIPAEAGLRFGGDAAPAEASRPSEADEGSDDAVSAWADEQVFEALPPEPSPFLGVPTSEADAVEPEGEPEIPTAGADLSATELATPSFVAPPAPGFDYGSAYEEEAFEEEPLPSQAEPERPAPPAESASVPREEVAPPSAMVSASAAGAGNLAINSIDARELVAGLFERWERALEQRIQAEQRLRFEAELEQRMRQVRDLRQELDQTRQAQAAEMAEREREVMELRNRIRDLEQAPRGRGLFRR
jgi:polyhydroxyalkanoate synthesis regulator phasin